MEMAAAPLVLKKQDGNALEAVSLFQILAKTNEGMVLQSNQLQATEMMEITTTEMDEALLALQSRVTLVLQETPQPQAIELQKLAEMGSSLIQLLVIEMITTLPLQMGETTCAQLSLAGTELQETLQHLHSEEIIVEMDKSFRQVLGIETMAIRLMEMAVTLTVLKNLDGTALQEDLQLQALVQNTEEMGKHSFLL